ncbi:Fasciclin-domain-containing protein [Microthyrium microscopicum]|uniref:Fasciclin-domain-containing protein n=1 Tax=Microthyrium microscopicum TaxID=703497 RepID=A0A6A6U6P4_9PEZI|nr:Fasciclin-domain-containing protein [Microthyrium microscopicum]
MKTSFITFLGLCAAGAQAFPQHSHGGMAPPAPMGALKSASETAQAAGLTSLVSALTSAGLAATVDGLKDVTIFAPTNAAFDAIASTTKTLSKDALGNVLKYHVVPTTAFSKDLKDGQVVKTLQGGSLTVKIMNGKVMVNNANVVKADVAITGGVVHVIDAVLLPK